MIASGPLRLTASGHRNHRHRSRRSGCRGLVAGALLVTAGLAACSRRSPDPVTMVAAAASLRAVVPELIESFSAASPGELRATFGASGNLRRQVEAGAPIDLVVLAAADPVDALIEQGLAVAESRRVVATNRLILVARPEAPPMRFATLDRLPAGFRLAVGDPRTVPAGWYARQALRSLGTWEALRDRLILGGHVAAVLTYARRGEVEAAIVYETDIRGVDDLIVLDRADPSWAPTPQIVAALVAPADATALRFLDFMTSPAGREILRAHRFIVEDSGGLG